MIVNKVGLVNSIIKQIKTADILIDNGDKPKATLYLAKQWLYKLKEILEKEEKIRC